MAHRQILISALDGRTLCLQFESDSITGADVGARVAAVTGIPQGCLRLVTGTGEITSEMCLGAGGSNDGMLPSCSVVLRLRGGKGGFGSLLRGAATKAGQKKTSNFDACRDNEPFFLNEKASVAFQRMRDPSFCLVFCGSSAICEPFLPAAGPLRARGVVISFSSLVRCHILSMIPVQHCCTRTEP
jgi:hypothetical protein